MKRLSDIVNGASAFAEEMRSQGIHVGFGNPARCVVDGEVYPCAAARPDGLACLADSDDDDPTGH